MTGLEFHTKRCLSLAITDLGAQVGDLAKGGVKGVIIRSLEACPIECIEIIDAQAGYHSLCYVERLDGVEILNA